MFRLGEPIFRRKHYLAASFLLWVLGVLLVFRTDIFTDLLKIDGDTLAITGYTSVVLAYLGFSMVRYFTDEKLDNESSVIRMLRALGLTVLLSMLSWFIFILLFMFFFLNSF